MSERAAFPQGATPKLDPRALRSRRAIIEAFVACAGERGLEAVGVAETCRRAGVNRATFYRHFEDKADLLERGLDLVLGEAVEAAEAADRPAEPFDIRVSRRIAAFFELVRARSGFYRGLVSGPAHAAFASKLEALLASFFADRRLPRLGAMKLPADLASRALASALVAFVAWWLDMPSKEGTRPESAEEMGRLFLEFAARGLSSGTAGPRA